MQTQTQDANARETQLPMNTTMSHQLMPSEVTFSQAPPSPILNLSIRTGGAYITFSAVFAFPHVRKYIFIISKSYASHCTLLQYSTRLLI